MTIDKPPLISIVIPFYRLPQFVEDTVISCINQTYKTIEIIVVDDCSSESESTEILKKLSTNYPRVKFLTHLERQGSAETRNTGIEAAKGKYAICLDADDKLAPTYVEKCLDLFKKDSRLGFVTSWMQVFGNSYHIIKTPQFDPPKLLAMDAFSSATMFLRQGWTEVGKFDKNIGSYVDWDFWISLLEKNYRWQTVEQPLIWYRDRANSNSKISVEQKNIQTKKLIEKHKKLYVQHMSDVMIELRSYSDSISQTKGWMILDKLRFLRNKAMNIVKKFI